MSAGSVTGSAPTVTLNLAMQIDGSTIVPFNAQAQFAAASSMAAVFSIITGTGAVQILSYDEVRTRFWGLMGRGADVQVYICVHVYVSEESMDK